MNSTIFLSYSSEQSEAATRIELSLKGDGHAVFRDRSSLPSDYMRDAAIQTLSALQQHDPLKGRKNHEKQSSVSQ